MKALALAVDRFHMEKENVKGGYIYIQPKKPAENSSDTVGYKPMKMAINYDDYEKLAKLPLPCFVEIEADFVAGGGGKVKAIAETVEPLKEGSFKIGSVEFKQIPSSSMPVK